MRKNFGTDVEQQLISQIKTSDKFAIQFDESTDIKNEAILLDSYDTSKKIILQKICFASFLYQIVPLLPRVEPESLTFVTEFQFNLSL